MKALLVSLLCLYMTDAGPISREPSTLQEIPLKKPEIQSLHIRSDIAFRFSTTHVTSQLANRNDNATEATFHVTLPKTAFMTNFSMNIEGKIIQGEVKEKEKAKAQYNKAQSQGQSAGYVAATKRESNSFEVTVNVEAGKVVTFDLEYQEVLRRRLGCYEHVINIDPGQVVADLLIEVNINESKPITKLRVPPLRKDNMEEHNDKVHPDAEITQNGLNSATITYKPSQKSQKSETDEGITGQFVVQYDVQRALDGGEIHVVDGYFVHALAPVGLPPVPKNVLFILDVSGSMSGRKIAQVRDAMTTILDDIRHDDTFNIMTFDARFTFWKNELQKVDDDTIKEAKKFISGIRDRGMTDIDGAISTGLNFLDRQQQSDKQRPSIIIFLTDGDPTEGETNKEIIKQNIRNLNQEKYTLFSLGFGEGVNFNFLKEMSLQNGGLARKIYEASDASIQLKNFYREVSIPLLSDVKIKYQSLGGEVSEVTKHAYKTFFSGSEMMVAGRLDMPDIGGECTVRPCFSGISGMGDIQICPPGYWPPRPWPPVTPRPTPSWSPDSGLAGYLERMWAYLTIQELLDKELRETNATQKEELRNEALKMSLKFKFVTPLTSMVVTLPEEPNATLGDLRDSGDSRKDYNNYPSARWSNTAMKGMPSIWSNTAMKGMPAIIPRSHFASGSLGMPGPLGPPMGGPSMSLSGNIHHVKSPIVDDMDTVTTTTNTPALPTTTSAPVLGSPSMVIRLPSGVVCLSWPQMSHSAHTILKDQGCEVQTTHGRMGTSESVMIRCSSQTFLLTPSQMLLGSQLRPWGQDYNENNVTVAGNTVTFDLLTGVKVVVHKINQARLVLELVDASGLTPSASGILRRTHSWLLRTRSNPKVLLTPTVNGNKQFVTSSASAAGITCEAAVQDVFEVTEYSRRA